MQEIEEKKRQVESVNAELSESIEQLKCALNSNKLERAKALDEFGREKSILYKKIQVQVRKK